MRYRTLSPTGDYVFGAGMGEFLTNSPLAVAQAIQTRLLLSQGEWYLDVTEGTPYSTEILGTGTQPIYDQAIQARILGTPGVVSIDSYSSFLNEKRALQINCTVTTLYGVVTLVGPQPIASATGPGKQAHLDFDFILDSSVLG